MYLSYTKYRPSVFRRCFTVDIYVKVNLLFFPSTSLSDNLGIHAVLALVEQLFAENSTICTGKSTDAFG